MSKDTRSTLFMTQPPHTPIATEEPPIARSGRNSSRSKHGCTTCRTRKVKCDETRPLCRRCEKSQIACDWDSPVIRRPTGHRKTLSNLANQPPAVIDDVSSSDPIRRATPVLIAPALTDSRGAATPSSTANQSSVGPFQQFSPGHALSNALDLNDEDQQSFEFMPNSLMVLRFGKPWRWSMLSYVHSKVARREKGVLRAFIAVASMERRLRELTEAQESPQPSASVDKANLFKENASNALHLAMQDLSDLLNRLALHPNNHEDLEALFALWFLILHFGIYDADLVHTSYMHLTGIHAFLSDWFHGPLERRVHALPPAATQLLMFICYLDVTLALGGQGDGKLSMFMMNEPPTSPISFDRLFEEARICVPQLWGSDYPAEELLDDIENYRPLRFFYSCQTLKLRTWEYGKAAIHGSQGTNSELWETIKNIGHEYYDILLLAKAVRRTNGRRVIWTVYHACLDYYGLKILYCCISGHDPRPPWLNEVLSDLLSVAYKALNEDHLHVYRYAWPLRMALFRLLDPIHLDWVHSQVTKAGLLLSNMGIPSTSAIGSSDESLFVHHHLSKHNSPTDAFR